MTKAEAVASLEDLKHLTTKEQNVRAKELEGAFKVFWNHAPQEKEFDKVMSGLILTPVVLYVMARRKFGVTLAKKWAQATPKKQANDQSTPS